MLALLAQSQIVAGDAEHMIWPVLAVALAATGVCGWLHFEMIQLLIRFVDRFTRTARGALLSTMLTLTVLHIVEIMIFALAYGGLHHGFGQGIGSIEGNFDGTVADVIYFSFVTYTTVGFGDVYPTGDIRLLTGVEALAGLMLITWSASFTFLIMQRHYEALAGKQASK